MKNLNKYLNNNQIEENLTQEQLLELKKLIEKKEKEFFTSRTKECYLWEINKRLEDFSKIREK